MSVSAKAVQEPTMVTIPEGWFLMGSESGQENERPVHRVWVDSFELAKCQVTNAEYTRYLAAGHLSAHRPQYFDDPNFSDPEQPIVAVSWFDAMAYCKWLSQETGKTYRLPYEAEWERAARGGMEGKQYSWGDEPPESLPDYQTRWTNGPEAVGRYDPNGYGLHNMGDNVHEWCSDWYGADYYARSSQLNPQGPPEMYGQALRRASRGGSWRHQIKVARCSARSSIPPEFRYADYGFRLARSISE
jgi:sulfatase modifying factor 1